MQTIEHKPVICEQVPNTWHYSTRNHSCQYKCTACGRTGRFNTNFLGGRKVVCDGHKFHKIRRPDLIVCDRCHKVILSLEDLAIDTGIHTFCTNCKPDSVGTYEVPEWQRCRLEDM